MFGRNSERKSRDVNNREEVEMKRRRENANLKLPRNVFATGLTIGPCFLGGKNVTQLQYVFTLL